MSDVHNMLGNTKVNFNPSFDKNGVPLMLSWTIEDVGEWINEELQLPKYKQCFVSNYICGRKLINIDASALPKLGVTYFADIKYITQKIRQLLGTEEPYWNRPVHLHPRDPVSHFLERKSHVGSESDALTYEEHCIYLKKYAEHKNK